MIQRHTLEEADFRGELLADHPRPLRGQQRPADADAAGHRHRHPRRVPRGRRGHRRDQHLQRDLGRAGRLRHRAPRPRTSTARPPAWLAPRPTSGRARTPDKPRFVAGAIGPTNRTALDLPGRRGPRRAGRSPSTSCAAPTPSRCAASSTAAPTCSWWRRSSTRLNAKAAHLRDRGGRRGDRRPPAADDLGHDHRPQRAARSPARRSRPSGSRWRTPGRSASASTARSARADMRPVPGRPGARRHLLDAAATPTPACRTPSASTTRRRTRPPASCASSRGAAWSTSWAAAAAPRPDHIRADRRRRRRGEPRARARAGAADRAWRAWSRWRSRPDANFLMIGERTNVTGSRRFAELITRRRLRHRPRGRHRAGAQRREHHRREHGRGDARLRGRHDHVPEHGRHRARHRRVPIMVDSSKWSVIEAGLRACRASRSSTRSASRRARRTSSSKAALARRYGAAMVVMAFDEEGQADTRRAQGRDLRARLPPAGRAGRRGARGHHLRPQHLRRGHRHRGAQRLRDGLPRGHPADQGALPGGQDQRRRQQPLVLVPRQRRGARGHAQRLPLPREPRGDGHGHRQRGPADRLRADRRGAARGRRGRALRPPPRRHRAPGGPGRPRQGQRRGRAW